MQGSISSIFIIIITIGQGVLIFVKFSQLAFLPDISLHFGDLALCDRLVGKHSVYLGQDILHVYCCNVTRF